MPILTQEEKDAILSPKVKKWVPQVAPTHAEGNVFFDKDKHVLTFQTDILGVNINVNMESIRRVFNNTGVMIPNGTPCKQIGSDDSTGVVSIAPAQANTLVNAKALLVMTHDIEDQASGFGTYQGDVDDLDLSSLAETGQTLIKGLPLFLSASEEGKYTMIAPDIATQIGGFLTGEQGVSNGNLAIKIEDLINLPTLYGALEGGTISATVTQDVWTSIANYAGSSSVVIPVDNVAGTIHSPLTKDGASRFRLNLNFICEFDNIGGTGKKELLFRIVDVTDIANPTSGKIFRGYMLKDATEASLTISPQFSTSDGIDYIIQMQPVGITLTNFSFSLAEYDLTSIHIRV